MLKKCEDVILCGQESTDIISSNHFRDLLVFCGLKNDDDDIVLPM